MTTFTETLTETFHVVSCYHCSLRFGIPDQLHRRAYKEAKGSIYCPACGGTFGWGESEAAKEIRQLKASLESANRRADTASRRADNEAAVREHAENRLRATKGVVTRIKNRVGKGVCPCCNRTFENLQKHMATKHPDYAESQ